MNDEIGAALARLIDDVAACPRAQDVATRWGTSAPSELRPGGIRVECSGSEPFAALEIRPWDADGYGLVDVDLRPGTSAAWSEIRDRFGPFEEGTMTARAGPERIARQPPREGASVTLIAELDEDEDENQIVALTIRRDRPRED